ncbi:hypothetical protein ACSHWG_00865 [Leucobacter sp. Z1108]|uniref:hypothetical protein n=1 Tax=Leucobacter sp. Z1108 TaxID=3439066 RepID=UPI003F36A717
MFIKKWHPPFALFRVTDPEDGGADTPPAQDGDLGFPANTPWKSMELPEQVAYWRHQSRKHEGEKRPVDWEAKETAAAKWQAHLDAENAKKTDPQPPAEEPPVVLDEAAVNAAREEGRVEGVNLILQDAVRAQIQAYRPNLSDEDLDDVLDTITLDKFKTEDGRLDTDRVKKLADKLAGPPEGDGTSQKTPPFTFGDVLKNSQKPVPGQGGSVQDYKAAEAARYQSTTK